MSVARVVVDIPTRAITEAFDYSVAPGMQVHVGHAVLVDFGPRPVVGYVVGLAEESTHERLKPVREVLDGPYFAERSVEIAEWIARTYITPLSEAVRLFAPPGGTPKAVRSGNGWELRRAGVGPVDDRWAELTADGLTFEPARTATMQRAVLDALRAGPVRTPELAADLGNVNGALTRLEQLGAVRIQRRRRHREAHVREKAAPRHENLTSGQVEALDVISKRLDAGHGAVLLNGITGSGKTEVYLRAIETVLLRGRGAIVLVPEISLTPQTVGRFRSRFGDQVAVMHSRLSAGERYDQWDRARQGESRIVVGARSALFAPLRDIGLIVIDEEHESSYKQGSSPRYHARDVAERLAESHSAVLVLGSASPSMEAQHRVSTGRWTGVDLPERVNARPLPEVEVVDMTKEFESGHRSMFSRSLIAALEDVRSRGEKAVVLLNRRGFASFLLCRECGFVPKCESCSVSLTYHEIGKKLVCHHCGARAEVPDSCPTCGSPYLRQFGAGTQRVETELLAHFPDLPVVRMDADTTTGKGAHERALVTFEAIEGSGVLLGTQMIAKGLDYPDVTLVAVINADTSLHLPDYRASERAYQLLEQVAGRAGRGELPGRVIIQTYWPEHPAIIAAALHEPGPFYAAEERSRQALGYPPFGRLVNVLLWGADSDAVRSQAEDLAARVRETCPDSWQVLGPSPAPLARLKGVFRWHVVVKAPEGADVSTPVAAALNSVKPVEGVAMA
ncbi:MAG: primosomal protein N', partial [Coriobacteriales bacterium]|nr:primosomal protein N' [Coriobacteriales bacterium]